MTLWKKALSLKLSSEDRWKWYLKHEYGLTLTEYKAMVAAQDSRCKICGNKGRLAVDHDHETGKVRGLLCKRCNYSLVGCIEKNLKLAKKVVRYLETA